MFKHLTFINPNYIPMIIKKVKKKLGDFQSKEIPIPMLTKIKGGEDIGIQDVIDV